MDMWEPYAQAVKEGCPSAAIVYDFFHIVANYNQVITQVRRSEYHRASKEDKLPDLTRFVKMLVAHKEGILNHATYPIHTSKLEGVNNKIKVLKREAYGFHDLEYFSLKIKQRCHGKPKIDQQIWR